MYQSYTRGNCPMQCIVWPARPFLVNAAGACWDGLAAWADYAVYILSPGSHRVPPFKLRTCTRMHDVPIEPKGATPEHVLAEKMDAIERKPNIKEMTSPTPEAILVGSQSVSNESSRSGDGVDLVEVDSIQESTR